MGMQDVQLETFWRCNKESLETLDWAGGLPPAMVTERGHYGAATGASKARGVPDEPYMTESVSKPASSPPPVTPEPEVARRFHQALSLSSVCPPLRSTSLDRQPHSPP